MIRRRGTPPPTAVHLRAGALAAATAAATGSHPDETGGILLGWRTDTAVVVADAIEVPDVAASPHRYRRHHAVAQTKLAAALATGPCDGIVGYIGEWHVHPADQGPSWQDRREIAVVSRLTSGPVTLIVIAGMPGAWRLHALNGWHGRTSTAVIEREEGR